MNLYWCENISSGIRCHYWAACIGDIPYFWTDIRRVKINHKMGDKL